MFCFWSGFASVKFEIDIFAQIMRCYTLKFYKEKFFLIIRLVWCIFNLGYKHMKCVGKLTSIDIVFILSNNLFLTSTSGFLHLQVTSKLFFDWRDELSGYKWVYQLVSFGLACCLSEDWMAWCCLNIQATVDKLSLPRGGWMQRRTNEWAREIGFI